MNPFGAAAGKASHSNWFLARTLKMVIHTYVVFIFSSPSHSLPHISPYFFSLFLYFLSLFFFFLSFLFLSRATRLYKPLCWSVGRSVGPSVTKSLLWLFITFLMALNGREETLRSKRPYKKCF